MYVCPGLLQIIHRSNYELFGKTTIFTEESIGSVCLPWFTTKNTSGNLCILRSKLGQAVINDGLFGNYRLLVLVSFHSS